MFCGEGPERARLKRAAERWGIADRVTFVGWLTRDQLVSRIALAGALVHPALHEEGGLCVAEALALGTPAVCLDHGGPAEVLRQWPGTPSVGVPVSDAETTARALARAIDSFLDDPPPVCDAPRPSAVSFAQALSAAYESAAQSGRAMVWAFPRGKPQLFANSFRALSGGVTTYAFGRRLPRLVQTGVALAVRFPVLRLLVSQRQARVEPVCGRELWQELAQAVQQRNPNLSGEWLHFSSQWDKRRSSFIGFNTKGTPELFLTIEAVDNPLRAPVSSAASYRVPVCRNAFSHAEWTVREFEPLPPFHRPALWDPSRIRQVAADVSRALEGRFDRPAGMPAHWRPMHGDLVPWNLR